jgi:TolB-like protein
VIAVIPFDTDPSQIFFADGLADDLTTRMGQTPGLSVVGRSRSRAYRGRQPRDVARELRAAVVLNGSTRPAGDTVNLSLALIDPSDGTTIWSAQYKRDVKEIFAVQAQVADEVAQALRVKLTPTPAAARAASRLVDPRAYESYLRGRQAVADRRLPYAIALFERAIAADAGLGEAFAGLAGALRVQIGLNSAVDDSAHRERMLTAARRAYELDPDLPAANIAMGLLSTALADTLKYFRRAIEIDPSYAEAYRLIGEAVNAFDAEQGSAFLKKSLSLDPPQVDAAAPRPAVARVPEDCAAAAPGDMRCGLYAAAARRKGVQAAAMLDRIAASEPMLRAFAAAPGQPGMTWIDPRSPPWSLIAGQPQFIEAHKRLEAAYVREREIARAAMKGLP